MPSNHHEEETNNTAKSATVHTTVVQDDTSIGARIGQVVSGGAKVVHGIGEAIRGFAIDVADLGKGSGKTIAEDGRAEAREGVKEAESSLRR
ncbi:hypothetical protein BJV74DRAFT_854462 [Russula compacta]|nr:hypothetical protein BJV74DRAFT_854462 [Russula compacta]